MLFVLGGCGDPIPRRPINATLHPDFDIYVIGESIEDTYPSIRLKCKFIGIDTFVTKDKWFSHWRDYWYLNEWDVLEVLAGTWDPKQLRFITTDRWPKPESGIMVSKPLYPYQVDSLFIFDLVSSKTSIPVIVKQQKIN